MPTGPGQGGWAPPRPRELTALLGQEEGSLEPLLASHSTHFGFTCRGEEGTFLTALDPGKVHRTSQGHSEASVRLVPERPPASCLPHLLTSGHQREEPRTRHLMLEGAVP